MKIAMLGLRALGRNEGGVERVVEELSTRLANFGHDVTVFCRSRYNPDKLTEYKGVHLVNGGAIYTKHLEAITHTAGAALHTLRGYDIVHFHAMGPALLSFLPRMTGPRVVTTVHGLDFEREKWGGTARCALRAGAWAAGTFAHGTIVVSRSLQDYYKTRLHKETSYIPNAPPAAKYEDKEWLEPLGVAGKDYLLYLGRLVPEKGCLQLIQAFRTSKTTHKLLIAGTSTHSDDYVRALREAARGDRRIIFAGSVFGETKHAAFSHALGLVFPSTLEGMPLVLLEAMMHGCPVLCSDIAPNMEIVQENGSAPPCARIFHTGDAKSLFTGIEKLLAEPAENAMLANVARESVKRRFNWDTIARQTEQFYKNLLNPVSAQNL